MLKRPALLACLLLSVRMASADIYKYVDENGVVNYTNMPSRLPSKAERIAVEPGTTQAPASPAAAPSHSKPATVASPAGFPKIDGDTQRKRDDARRQILEAEVQSEQKALDEARQALASGQEVRMGNEKNYQKYLDRVKGLQDAVATHQANLDALQQEIGKLR